jgi:hypothetical protein
MTEPRTYKSNKELNKSHAVVFDSNRIKEDITSLRMKV